MTEIHICHVTDVNQIDYIITLWKSIIFNNYTHRFNLYLIHNINDQTIINKFKQRFNSIYPEVSLYTFFLIDNSEINYSTTLSHVTFATMLRLFIPDVLKDVEKVLYLDIDLIVVGDLENIWRLECGEMGMCLKESILPGWNKKEKKGYRSGNAGVILMNLTNLRANNFVETVLKLNKTASGHDQDLINQYLKGKFNDLDGNMNIYLRQDNDLHNDPIIYHMVGPEKPWNSLSPTIYFRLWHSYHKLTLFKNPKLSNSIPTLTGIGVLKYDTENIGDWTQSVAALHVWWIYFGRLNTFKYFLESCIEKSKIGPYPLIWINRDRMSLAVKPEGVDKVVTLCNAWWMHKYNEEYNFIPPDWIIPIYTSVHICRPKILSSSVVEYLKKYEPIGCRDKDTQKLLEKKGVAAFFSGCLTMTLNFKDANFGFTPTNVFSDKVVYVDYLKKCELDEGEVSISQIITDIHNINNLLITTQRCVDLMFARKIITKRLHVWLPLICNKSNVVLMNFKTGKTFKHGDRDNHGQKINRFTGLTQIISDASNLTCFSRLLLNKTLYHISKLLSV